MKKDLNKKQYSEFKNLSYRVYMMDYKNGSNKAQCIMTELLKNYDSYDSEQLNTIFANTILFPFDLELYNFLIDRNFSEDTIQFAAEKFGISVDTVKQKISEYVKNSFINCVGEGLIDYNIILELSKQLLVYDSVVEKNQKVS